MKQNRHIQWLFVMLISLASCNGQNPTEQSIRSKNQIGLDAINAPNDIKSNPLTSDSAPNSITRSIIQDKVGNIWFTTFEGIFKYDGISFSNPWKEVNSSRFFSALEDSKGNLWFGSIGAGIYLYDGISFQNFTTTDGLINDEIVSIHEDKMGNIWFGANGGVSLYDGKSFRNYMIKDDTMVEADVGSSIPNMQRPINEVNSIIEDKSGKVWFGTRGNTFIYDGNTFDTVTHNGKPFTNVRWIIEDKIGNIWLGGRDGLYRYDGITFDHITHGFVGYIYEDRIGNIWTSSETGGSWTLSRYELSVIDNQKRTLTKIKSGEGMFFGILEDSDGNIWTGTLDGIYRYDGNTFDDFKK